MERAKRLELIRVLLEALSREVAYFDGESADSLADALDANGRAEDGYIAEDGEAGQ